MKRLLFIVNGLGMGNSTRCDSIIECLIQQGYAVDILTSGNGLRYFKENGHGGEIFEIASLYYGKDKNGKLSIGSTLRALPDLFRIYRGNVRRLKRLLTSGHYRAVLIDSDYTMLWLKQHARIPIIALNNADIVIDECRTRSDLPSSIRLQLLIERLDNLFHQRIPHLVLSPAICDPATSNEHIKHYAPFIRSGLTGGTSETVQKILVMLSGSQFGSKTDFLRDLPLPKGARIDVVGREGESDADIHYHGRVLNNRALVNEADLMVINAGFSAVSEAVVLRKPAVVLPIENHAEQHINACIFEEQGLGLTASIENAPEKITELIARFKEFCDNHKRFDANPHGAIDAARDVDAFIERYPHG